MKVYMIRHGQSEGNRLNRHCGWSTTPLSETGRQQASRASHLLEGITFDRVYCSDLVRTQQTAQLALPGQKLILSDKIREIGVGTLADRLMEDCNAEYGEVYRLSCKHQDFSAFGGETQSQMRDRVRDFIRELEQQQADTVAVVAHEGTVHQMICYVLGHEVMLEHLHIENASATVFELTNGVWKLVSSTCSPMTPTDGFPAYLFDFYIFMKVKL